MSAGRYEIFDDGPCIRIVSPDSTISTIVGRPVGYHIDDAVIGAIRQQARDIDQLCAECDLLTHKVICCGVAAWHSDPLLTTTGAYAGKWNSPQADCVRKLRAERDQLRADLAAAVADRDRMAKHIKELDAECSVIAKDCTYAEQQNDTLRARIAAIDAAPTVATIWANNFAYNAVWNPNVDAPHGTDLIARPAKDQP